MEWRGLGASLAYATARKGFAEAVTLRRGDRGVAHPDLLTGPAFRRRIWLHGLAKQRPLHAERRAVAVDEIGGHVPPFDAEIRVRTVIGGKRENLARRDRRKSFAVRAEPGKALRTCQLAAEAGSDGGGCEGTAGDREPIVHRRKS